MKLPKLNDMLNYPHDKILERYRNDHSNNTLSAEQAWEEIIKFLWLGEKHKIEKANNPDDSNLQFNFGIHPEMKEIDDMWHTFILFTKEYSDFGHQFFRRYIHHQPTTTAEKEAMQKNADKFLNEDTRRWLSYAYDHLGKTTVKTWFADYFK